MAPQIVADDLATWHGRGPRFALPLAGESPIRGMLYRNRLTSQIKSDAQGPDVLSSKEGTAAEVFRRGEGGHLEFLAFKMQPLLLLSSRTPRRIPKHAILDSSRTAGLRQGMPPKASSTARVWDRSPVRWLSVRVHEGSSTRMNSKLRDNRTGTSDAEVGPRGKPGSTATCLCLLWCTAFRCRYVSNFEKVPKPSAEVCRVRNRHASRTIFESCLTCDSGCSAHMQLLWMLDREMYSQLQLPLHPSLHMTLRESCTRKFILKHMHTEHHPKPPTLVAQTGMPNPKPTGLKPKPRTPKAPTYEGQRQSSVAFKSGECKAMKKFRPAQRPPKEFPVRCRALEQGLRGGWGVQGLGRAV